MLYNFKVRQLMKKKQNLEQGDNTHSTYFTIILGIYFIKCSVNSHEANLKEWNLKVDARHTNTTQ